MRKIQSSLSRKKILSILMILCVITTSILIYPETTSATAGLLDTASEQMSNSIPSAAGVTYTGKFNIGSTATIKCINVVFATNADMTGGAPTGITTTSAIKGTITGTGVTNTNWSLYGSAPNGTLQFENSTGESHTAGDPITALPATTITNPSGSTFYAQITTYSTLTTHACSGQVDQTNVIALVTTGGVSATVTVQPTLSLSVANFGSAVNGSGASGFVTTTSSTIPFGAVAAGTVKPGSQTLTVSTNAAHGYSVYVSDTGTMKDLNTDTLTDQTGTPGAPQNFTGSSSVSSFGYTADGPGVTFGSNKWAGLGNSQVQSQIATRTAPINADAFHVEFDVEPSNTQAPGTYSTTVIYTAVGSY
jgi:hypothetical protein